MEIAQWSVRLALEMDPTNVLIEIDEMTAFQKTDRDVMARGLLTARKGALKKLLPYFQSMYEEATELCYGTDWTLKSESGNQQGCTWECCYMA